MLGWRNTFRTGWSVQAYTNYNTAWMREGKGEKLKADHVNCPMSFVPHCNGCWMWFFLDYSQPGLHFERALMELTVAPFLHNDASAAHTARFNWHCTTTYLNICKLDFQLPIWNLHLMIKANQTKDSKLHCAQNNSPPYASIVNVSQFG